MIEQVALSGIAIWLIGFVFYWLALAHGLSVGAVEAAVLWLLVWCEKAHCFNCRSETRSTSRIPLAHNPPLVGGLATGMRPHAVGGPLPREAILDLAQGADEVFGRG